MPSAWYKNWFDTEYYHKLYSHRNDEEAQLFLDNLIKHLELRPDMKLIDIACGKGRHSIYLNKRGYDVTGIDLAKSSIGYASQFENDRLRFFVHDNRKVFWPGHFDVALNLFTSFGYLETRSDLLNQLKHMAENLRGGGRFILDYFNSAYIATCSFDDEQIVKDDIHFVIKKRIEGHQVIKTIHVNSGTEEDTYN